MVRKMATWMAGASLIVGLVGACAGNQTGTGEGGGCSSDDSCDTDLWCQPITGRNGDFCCPSPLVYPGGGGFVSSQTNCQPVQPK